MMLGYGAWVGQRLNFANFMVLPISFGISADYAVNVIKRYQTDRGGGLAAAISGTGGAVALCSLTTIIGYGALLVAQNQALYSFGVFAVAGELTCLFTAVISMPTALALASRSTSPVTSGEEPT